MPLWLLLVMLGLGGFAAYQFWRGLKIGSGQRPLLDLPGPKAPIIRET
jgi:hypothetical protein